MAIPQSTPAGSSTGASQTAPAPTGRQGNVINQRTFRSACWNWLGVGIEMLVGVLLVPLLVRRLGEGVYGTWIAIGSLTGYLGILDFGLRGSVGRHIAFYRARNDETGVLTVLNTAALVLLVIGLIGFLALSALAWKLGALRVVPAGVEFDARVALWIVAAHLGLWFVLRIFDAALWGFERFDLLNMVDIPAAACRGLCAAFAASAGYGLIGLACVTLSLTITVGLVKLVLCFYVDRRLRFSPAYFDRTAIGELFGYGVWNFLASLGEMGRTQLSPALVGGALGMAAVTPFSIVLRLVNTAGTIVGAGTGVLTPVATALHAQGDWDRQRRLFLESGRFCVAGAVFFFALFAFLGAPLLQLWVGPQLASAHRQLLILACGELVPTAISMSTNTILGMARNRPLAFRGAAECATSIALSVVLGQRYGLDGVCAAMAFSATLWRGLFMVSHAARLIELEWPLFLFQSVLPMLVAACVPVALLWGAVQLSRPTRWAELCAYAGAFGLMFLCAALPAAIGLKECGRLVIEFRGGTRGPRPESAAADSVSR